MCQSWCLFPETSNLREQRSQWLLMWFQKFWMFLKVKWIFRNRFFLYRDPICGSPSNRDAHLSIFRFVQIIWVDFARDSVSAKVKHQSDHFRPKYIDPSIKKYRDNAQFHRIEQSGEIPMSKIRWSPLTLCLPWATGGPPNFKQLYLF